MTSEEMELLMLRYGDGLLEGEEERAARQLLETDPQARAYLEDLEGLQQTFDECPIPAPSRSLLPTLQQTKRGRGLQIWAVAASLAILGAAIGLQWKQAQQKPAIESTAEIVTVTKTLRYAYRERAPDSLDRIFDSRQRLDRLRTQVSGRARFPHRTTNPKTEKPPC